MVMFYDITISEGQYDYALKHGRCCYDGGLWVVAFSTDILWFNTNLLLKLFKQLIFETNLNSKSLSHLKIIYWTKLKLLGNEGPPWVV